MNKKEEIFTIGEKVEQGVIKSFNIIHNKCRVTFTGGHSLDLSYLTKVKKHPLFKSEDGVDIFEGDEYFELITPDFHNKPCIWNILPNKTRGNIIYDQISNKNNGRLWFSTKKAAKNYIKCNKPCLSFNDIWNSQANNILEHLELHVNNTKHICMDKKELTKLVEQKLKN